MEFKVFNDSVHGHMEFHPLLVVVADTPQFQRLRNIKQLGICYFVYPSAIHSRFEHSIGTAFIAGRLFDSMREKRLPSDVADESLWERRKLCAQIAGLCHDIGHGPFSHTWEAFRKRFKDEWTHEEESLRVFDELLNENISPTKKFNGPSPKLVRDAFAYYGLDEADIQLIKKMISGTKKESKKYLFQVICNKLNGIDVDKWEYLTRDSVMLNIPIGFDYKRLLNYCCILADEEGQEQICYREKECSVLLEMFLARGKLHDVGYQHTKVKILEEMLLDAFQLANERLKLRETPITKLTDHIYQKILYDDFGDDKNMKKAKEILGRIESRHLYKCIAQETCEECPDLKAIKSKLGQIKGIKPYIEEISTGFVRVHMTKSNKQKALKNVLVYEKNKDQRITCKPFDWNSYQDCLKPNVESLSRSQVLLLYKGKEEFPSFLFNPVRETFKQCLVDLTV